MGLGWNETLVQHLECWNRSFRKKSIISFDRYLLSAILTRKWHELIHQCEAIIHVGGIGRLHAGVYEASHSWFKSFYADSSRRRRKAMDKVVSMQNAEKPKAQKDIIECRVPEKSMKESAEKARTADSSIPATSNAKRSLFAFKTVMFDVEIISKRLNDMGKGTWRDDGSEKTTWDTTVWRIQSLHLIVNVVFCRTWGRP